MEEVKQAEARFSKKKLFKPDSTAMKRVPEKKMNITREKLESFMPRGASHKITDELLQQIDNMEKDTGLPQDLMEEEVLSYLYLVKKVPRVKLRELVNAVKFCNLKRNHSNEKAWAITFPDKHDKLVREGRQVASHVAMYNQSDLVVEIDKEMLIPVYIQYAPYQHAAIKKQYELMNGRVKNREGEPMNVSPMVQHLAAKSLYEMTAMPQESKIDLTISKGAEEISMQKEMNGQLAELVKLQKRRLDAGEDISTVQKIGISFNEDMIDAEVEGDG